MPIATRWGSRTICFPTSSRSASPTEQMRLCDPIPDPEDRRDPRDAAPRDRQLRVVHEVPRAAPRAADRRVTRAGERVFAAIGCAACHVPVARRPARAATRCSIARRWRCSRICCCTTSAPATASSRPPRPPRRSARRRCGACGSAGRCCTTAARPTIAEAIERHRSEADLARRGFAGLPPAARERLLAFLRSL